MEKLVEETTRLKEDLFTTKEDLSTTKEILARTQELLADSTTILPTRFSDRTRLSSVNILSETRAECVGVGFFLGTHRRIVAALHVLTEHYPGVKVKRVVIGLVHRSGADGSVELIETKFSVIKMHKQYDIAVLELHSQSQNDAEACLELPPLDYDYSEKRLAITSFSSSLAREAPLQINNDFCVLPAYFLKCSDHHIVYSSNCFSGDSGGAILLSHDGFVRAMHQETVNQAREKLERISMDDESIILMDSINSLTSCMSQGFIGLRLDVSDIQDLILC